MSRRLSLNARLAQDGLAPDQIEVVLFKVTHPDLEAPIRLSTDNADLITDDPRVYGTRSTWGGADPATDPYLWIVASAVVPGDDDSAPAAAQVAIENLDASIAGLLRSFTTPATVDIAVVMADTPDLVEGEWQGLQLVTSEGDEASIIVALSRDEIEQEPFPSGRMTRYKFPGLHL